jgi:hypothetical protein
MVLICLTHERSRERIQTLVIADRAWSPGELIDALAVATPDPTETAPEPRRRFQGLQAFQGLQVIEGGKKGPIPREADPAPKPLRPEDGRW